MQKIPDDPVMLLSYINTQLRDNYPSLTELCRALSFNETQIKEKLEAIDYVYEADANQFR